MSALGDPWRLVCPECKVCTYKVFPCGEKRYKCKNGHEFNQLYDKKLEKQRNPKIIQ